MKELRKGYSNSRASRTVDRYMIAICALFIFALCSTSYSAAAQNPNLLDQLEQDFNELTEKAISWSDVSESNTDIIALVDEIGLGSECADWVLEPMEDGEIDILFTSLPAEFPLCIDNTFLCNYYVDIYVKGGYDLLLYGWTIELTQKGDWKGTLGVMIDPNMPPWKDTGYCCSEWNYRLKLYVLDDPDQDGKICFDADNYPIVGGDFYYEDHIIPVDPIPDKEIDAHFCSLWSGCISQDQQFTISLVQRYLSNKSYVSPLMATHYF